MNKVQRAYLIDGAVTQRVLVDSRNQVYVPGQGWSSATGQVITVPGVYERPFDVPAAWLGVCPWWKR